MELCGNQEELAGQRGAASGVAGFRCSGRRGRADRRRIAALKLQKAVEGAVFLALRFDASWLMAPVS